MSKAKAWERRNKPIRESLFPYIDLYELLERGMVYTQTESEQIMEISTKLLWEGDASQEYIDLVSGLEFFKMGPKAKLYTITKEGLREDLIKLLRKEIYGDEN